MRHIVCICALAVLTSMGSACMSSASAQDAIPLMDFYTVDQRYYRNVETHPEIEWPTLTFAHGQSVSFDRLYKEEDGRKLHVDVFGPSEEVRNGRAVILVHGGAWRSGNKSHMFLLANLLAQRGYTVFTPEYRLSVEAPYPTGLVDLNDLIVWVKDNAEELEIDPAAVAIAGGSSGGHMAALLGFSSGETLFRSDAGDDTSVAAVIDMDGVLDFRTDLALQYENRAGANSGVALWVGGAYETATELWVEASPVVHLSEDAPPTLIISSGNPRFTEGHLSVEAWLTARDIPYEFYSYEDMFHTFWLFDPYASEVADRIDAFLEQVFPVSLDYPSNYQIEIDGQTWFAARSSDMCERHVNAALSAYYSFPLYREERSATRDRFFLNETSDCWIELYVDGVDDQSILYKVDASGRLTDKRVLSWWGPTIYPYPEVTGTVFPLEPGDLLLDRRPD